MTAGARRCLGAILQVSPWIQQRSPKDAVALAVGGCLCLEEHLEVSVSSAKTRIRARVLKQKIESMKPRLR